MLARMALILQCSSDMTEAAPPDPKFPEIPRNQRVVVRHLSGLHQICGHTDDLPKGQVPDTTLCTLPNPSRTVAVDLVASRPRYLLYKEANTDSGLGTFDKAQR